MLCRRKPFNLNQVIEPFLTHLLWFSFLATTPKRLHPPLTHLTPSSLLSFKISEVFSRIESESIQGNFLFSGGGSVSLEKSYAARLREYMKEHGIQDANDIPLDAQNQLYLDVVGWRKGIQENCTDLFSCLGITPPPSSCSPLC
ncbi:hypothetical protein AKJ16_DCAP11978 [Drosera capensis]